MGAYGGIPVAIGEIHSPGPSGNSGPSVSEMSCGHREDLIPEVVLHLCTVRRKHDQAILSGLSSAFIFSMLLMGQIDSSMEFTSLNSYKNLIVLFNHHFH